MGGLPSYLLRSSQSTTLEGKVDFRAMFVCMMCSVVTRTCAICNDGRAQAIPAFSPSGRRIDDHGRAACDLARVRRGHVLDESDDVAWNRSASARVILAMMRTRLAAIVGAGLVLALVVPVATAKVFFPMRDHVLVAGKQVHLAVPGCQTPPGCIANYPGPVRLYLVRADVPGQVRPVETADPPRPARPLGRLGNLGRVSFTPRAAGQFRLVALFSVQPPGGEVRSMRMAVSSVFVVHPRGWQ
jgi:hypothetical protein